MIYFMTQTLSVESERVVITPPSLNYCDEFSYYFFFQDFQLQLFLEFC